MSVSQLVGSYFSPVSQPVGHTEVVSGCLWVHVRACFVLSMCVMHVVSCQDMLTHGGAMSAFAGDVRGLRDR